MEFKRYLYKDTGVTPPYMHLATLTDNMLRLKLFRDPVI